MGLFCTITAKLAESILMLFMDLWEQNLFSKSHSGNITEIKGKHSTHVS